MIQGNEVLDKLPEHLLDLVIDQPYNAYTAKDHAVWRYVMRQNVAFLTEYSYGDYLKGLAETGVSIDTIPHMYGMNRVLKDIGWAAAAVDGFIPPQAFMEFQANKVLVIAADIRTANHIHYTPAPDILHEAAGHAPIIADKAYAKYLQQFGKIGVKAFSSAKDYELYEAIRHLSIIKEYPDTTQDEVNVAEKQIARISQNLGVPSEMAKLRNLHWWTVEYGLIGSVDDYRIYGAGLLSSIGESKHCCTDAVKKLPYSLEAQSFNFDITNMQPQLFVANNVEHLNKVLEEFGNTMAYKKGGAYAIEEAEKSSNVATVELDSGVQISGIFSASDSKGEDVQFLKTRTATQLALNEKEIEGHSTHYHKQGFSSPVGKWKNTEVTPYMLSLSDLSSLGINEGKEANIEFASGYRVNGKLEIATFNDSKLVLLSFSNCTVHNPKGETVFQPDWGMYDMVIGSEVVSAWSGPADPKAFGWNFAPPSEKTIKITHNEQAHQLFALYQQLRDIRSGELPLKEEELKNIFSKVKKVYTDDWLLPLELLELITIKFPNSSLNDEIRAFLDELATTSDFRAKVISEGLELLGTQELVME
jgi:phenylalanine-4-hydroxylase